MKPCFSNSTVSWNEFEITRRESLIKEIPILLLKTWREINSAVKIERCETPILTPAKYLQSHIDNEFNLITTDKSELFLRPETTAGTFEIMEQKFPNKEQIQKQLPFCLWQVGCSFRDETNSETMRATKLRLKQFYQIEFQLFASQGSKAPYLEEALKALIKQYGGFAMAPDSLPHYSEKTIDWGFGENGGFGENNLEVAGLSVRKDWPHGMVFEVAIGLDRLVALQTQNTA